jgi:hypothetical protein
MGLFFRVAASSNPSFQRSVKKLRFFRPPNSNASPDTSSVPEKVGIPKINSLTFQFKIEKRGVEVYFESNCLVSGATSPYPIFYQRAGYSTPLALAGTKPLAKGVEQRLMRIMAAQ